MSERAVGNLLAFLAMVLWATQFPSMAEVMETWHPILMTPFRLSASAIFLLFVLLVTGGAHHIRHARWRDVWILGGGLLTLSTMLFVWGQKYAHPVTAAIIISLMPVISALLDILQKRAQVTAPIAIGIALAVVGGFVTTLEPGAGGLSFGLMGGEFFLLAAVVLFVVYTRETTVRLAGISELAQSAFTLAAGSVGAACVAAVAVLIGQAEPVYDFSLKSVGIIVWVGAMAVGTAMALWFTAARRLGVTITSMHHNMVPFYVILLSVAGGGMVLENQAWGALLVLCGAVLAQLPVTAWLKARQSRRETI